MKCEVCGTRMRHWFFLATEGGPDGVCAPCGAGSAACAKSGGAAA